MTVNWDVILSFIAVIIGAVVGLSIAAWFDNQAANSQEPVQFQHFEVIGSNAGSALWRDKTTGCHYMLISGRFGFVRVRPDGLPYCDPVE